MNYTLRNIIGIVLILFIALFGYYFLFARQEGQYMPQGWEDFDCMHPVSISSDSLQPTLKRGSILILNQCINNRENLQKGYIVSFNSEGIKKIGIIEDIQYSNQKATYTVSTDFDKTQQYEVSSIDILAYTTL